MCTGMIMSLLISKNLLVQISALQLSISLLTWKWNLVWWFGAGINHLTKANWCIIFLFFDISSQARRCSKFVDNIWLQIFLADLWIFYLFNFNVQSFCGCVALFFRTSGALKLFAQDIPLYNTRKTWSYIEYFITFLEILIYFKIK